jgi:hypothetical protein
MRALTICWTPGEKTNGAVIAPEKPMTILGFSQNFNILQACFGVPDCA